jgi:ESS family glutamate:Na+ symporter
VRRKAFERDPLQHMLLIYGIGTGTFLTGVALVRALDPKLRSPAVRNAVVAAAGEAVVAIPLVLVIMPWSVSAYGDAPIRTLAITLASLAGYTVMLALVIRRIARRSSRS